MIPLIDLRAQYLMLKDEIRHEFDAVLDGMELVPGRNTRAFEEEFEAYLGARHVVGVGSGTDALYLALRACGIGPGDEVITVSNTFIATVEAIVLAGAKPVLVDVEPSTYTLDVNQLVHVISPRTKAILPVHLYGHPADMAPILDVARTHHLRVIEDACQAHGATYRGQKVGTIGDVGCFSFYVSKNLGAYGEGGAVVTNDDTVAEMVAELRNHGSREKYHHHYLGINSRLDELQATVLRIKLRHLDEWNQRRRESAAHYRHQLAGLEMVLPIERQDARHVYHLYVIRVQQRDALRNWLAQHDIATGIHYPIPIHQQVAYQTLGLSDLRLPETEGAASQILSLPIYPEIPAEAIERVAQLIRDFFAISAIQDA